MPARKSDEVKAAPEIHADAPQSAGGRDFALEEVATRRALDEQPKRAVRLYQVPEMSTDNPLPDVFVSVNGHNYLLQRGKTIHVPETVAEVLENAGYAV